MKFLTRGFSWLNEPARTASIREQQVRMKQVTHWFAPFLLFPALALSSTWRVEQDGSGDFLSIQTAITAASAGDTILVGPGHYYEYQEVTLPGWSWPIKVYVYVLKDDLTIIGEDPQTVIIGPDVPDFQHFDPKGIVVVETVDRLKVEGLTVRNVYNGVYFFIGQLEVRDYCALACEFGIYFHSGSNGVIENCRFLDCTAEGVGLTNSGNVIVSDSFFSRCRNGVYLKNSNGIVISGHTIEGSGATGGGMVGVYLTENSFASIIDCCISNLYNYGIVAKSFSQAFLTGTMIFGSNCALKTADGGHAEGSGNIFSGGTFSTIYSSSGSISMQGNHILNNGGQSVFLAYFYSPPVHLDLTP